jgi:hypothetical protein
MEIYKYEPQCATYTRNYKMHKQENSIRPIDNWIDIPGYK